MNNHTNLFCCCKIREIKLEKSAKIKLKKSANSDRHHLLLSFRTDYIYANMLSIYSSRRRSRVETPSLLQGGALVEEDEALEEATAAFLVEGLPLLCLAASLLYFGL